jgi:MFS family permease
MAITTKSEAVRVPEQSVESSASAVEWAAIVGGALGAVGVSIILFTLGSGLGLSTVSPWSWSNPSPTTFGMVAAIWLIITQWLASALGGYLTGRLRKKWVGIRTDEVVFRDTAHGFLAWALATVLMATFITLAASAVATVPEATTNAMTVSAEAAEQARKAAAAFSMFTALSFLVGAFIGCVAGALGGYHRDEV